MSLTNVDLNCPCVAFPSRSRTQVLSHSCFSWVIECRNPLAYLTGGFFFKQKTQLSLQIPQPAFYLLTPHPRNPAPLIMYNLTTQEMHFLLQNFRALRPKLQVIHSGFEWLLYAKIWGDKVQKSPGCDVRSSAWWGVSHVNRETKAQYGWCCNQRQRPPWEPQRVGSPAWPWELEKVTNEGCEPHLQSCQGICRERRRVANGVPGIGTDMRVGDRSMRPRDASQVSVQMGCKEGDWEQQTGRGKWGAGGNAFGWAASGASVRSMASGSAGPLSLGEPHPLTHFVGQKELNVINFSWLNLLNFKVLSCSATWDLAWRSSRGSRA